MDLVFSLCSVPKTEDMTGKIYSGSWFKGIESILVGEVYRQKKGPAVVDRDWLHLHKAYRLETGLM